MAYKCSDVLPQASLVDICRNNMRARIRSMIIGNKSKNLGELLEASMEAETVIKDLNSQKSSKKEQTAVPTSKPKKKEVLNVQTKSAPQPPKKAENKVAGKRPELSDAFKERVEKKYPFDEMLKKYLRLSWRMANSPCLTPKDREMLAKPIIPDIVHTTKWSRILSTNASL
ncbi:hypothetical protein MRB53_010442 [Persea americana]|uniref:Uncharacterized protein n=1 Tax=Persea americana TaxID=3435 RepID=A0ACC2LS21_PERAE|nr:hypothetical protein MRB53_010442 [Persea americana]